MPTRSPRIKKKVEEAKAKRRPKQGLRSQATLKKRAKEKTKKARIKRTAAKVQKEVYDRYHNPKPTENIDLGMVTRLAHIHCTFSEIANTLNVPYQTLKNFPGFETAFRKGWERGKASLRRMQWAKARGGDSNMLIWLGKNVLHQSNEPAAAVGPPRVDAEPTFTESAGRDEVLKNLSDKDLAQLEKILGKVRDTVQ